MKKTFFTLLLTFLLQTCCCADSSIKFVQVTDIHFKADNQYSIDRVDKTVKDINNLKDVSFVVFTGDNIDHPIEKDLAIFIKKINKLKVPYYLVLGNHDVSKGQGLSKEKYNKVVRENNYLWFHLKWNYVFKKKGYTFIVLDGAKEGLQIVVNIFPTLLGLFLSISLLRDSGIIDAISKLAMPLLNLLKMPAEILPLALLRPISGSASMAVATDIMTKYGVDSLIGISLASGSP